MLPLESEEADIPVCCKYIRCCQTGSCVSPIVVVVFTGFRGRDRIVLCLQSQNRNMLVVTWLDT